MGTTADKLAKLADTKSKIRDEIILKLVDVPADAPFGNYPGYIRNIPTSFTPTGNIELQQSSQTNVSTYATATVKLGSAATPATSIDPGNMSISVNSSGLITATTTSNSASVIPSVTAGFVNSGTAGNITVNSKTGTKQLTTQAAKTVTPTTSSQTAVASGVYTTGAITVSAIQTETKTAIENGTITPTSGKYLSSVVVNVPYTFYITGHGDPSNSIGNDGDLYIDLG